MTRLDTSGLLRLGEDLAFRERELVEVLGRLRLMSHAQLAALLEQNGGRDTPRPNAASAARSARRILQRLTNLGVVARLERRIGGLRAGSAGYVYYLGPAGQRLVAYWNGDGLIRGRYRPEPAGRYVRHRLAVSELYVDLQVAAADGELGLLAFEVEPDCWRRHIDGFGGLRLLKPDAFVRIGLGAYEDRFFVEVDLSTESRSVIARKLRAYVDYWNGGQEQQAHGVFPACCFWSTPSSARPPWSTYARDCPPRLGNCSRSRPWSTSPPP